MQTPVTTPSSTSTWSSAGPGPDRRRGVAASRPASTRWVAAVGASLLFAAAACGGSDDAGGSDAASDAASDDAVAISITAEEVCAAIPGEQFQASVEGATGTFDQPSFSQAGCSYQFFDTAGATLLDVQIWVVNENGRAGYDAEAAEWAERGEATELDIGDGATTVDSGGARRVTLLVGDRVIAVNGPTDESRGFTPELAAAVADVAASALATS